MIYDNTMINSDGNLHAQVISFKIEFAMVSFLLWGGTSREANVLSTTLALEPRDTSFCSDNIV